MTIGALPITMAPAAGGKSVATEFGWTIGAGVSLANQTPRGTVPTSGFNLSAFVGQSNFSPVTRTYDTGTAATETAPAGATTVRITLWGGGGGGARDIAGGGNTGGASGAYVRKTQATSGGTTYTYTVGAGGPGRANSTDGGGTAGGASTISSPALSAGGGGAGFLGAGSAAGGTASGGDINTAGNSSVSLNKQGMGSPNGGANVSGVQGGVAGSVPGGGGSSKINIAGAGGAGAAGRIEFYYT
jgi:hypothetical protein